MKLVVLNEVSRCNKYNTSRQGHRWSVYFHMRAPDRNKQLAPGIYKTLQCLPALKYKRATTGCMMLPFVQVWAERRSWGHSKSFKQVREAQCAAAWFSPKKSRDQRDGLTACSDDSQGKRLLLHGMGCWGFARVFQKRSGSWGRAH